MKTAAGTSISPDELAPQSQRGAAWEFVPRDGTDLVEGAKTAEQAAESFRQVGAEIRFEEVMPTGNTLAASRV